MSRKQRPQGRDIEFQPLTGRYVSHQRGAGKDNRPGLCLSASLRRMTDRQTDRQAQKAGKWAREINPFSMGSIGDFLLLFLNRGKS